MDWHFYFQLASLSVIVIYTILVFRNVDPLVATAIGVGIGFLFNLSTPIEMGKALEASLGSFLALVGLIIMLGRGLGEILTETKASHTLVHKIVYSIGVNTQTGHCGNIGYIGWWFSYPFANTLSDCSQCRFVSPIFGSINASIR